MFTTSTVVTAVTVFVLLVAASVVLSWHFSRKIKRRESRATTPEATQQRRPDGRYQVAKQHAPLPAPSREQRIKEALNHRNQAIQSAREGRVDEARTLLEGTAGILQTTPTTALLFQAARSFVSACDQDLGTAGRLVTATLERLSTQWPNIEGGEATYRHIAELCGAAMRPIPLYKLGTEGAEVALLMHEARQYNREENSEAALACLSRAYEAVKRCPTLRWHRALRQDIERTSLTILEALAGQPDKEARAFVRGCTEEHERTRPQRHPAARATV